MTGGRVRAKAERLLAEGRVRVDLASGSTAHVSVRGDSATYVVVRGRGGWRCTCPAWGRCSHLEAAMLVVEPKRAAP